MLSTAFTSICWSGSDVSKDLFSNHSEKSSQKSAVPFESSRKSKHSSQDEDASTVKSRSPRRFKSPTPSCITPSEKGSDNEEELTGVHLKLWQEMQKMHGDSNSSSSDEDLSLIV